MIVAWTPGALRELEELEDYIAQDSPTAADLVVTRVMTAADTLVINPLQGRKGREGSGDDVHELVVPRTRYTLAYRIRDDVVEILAVVHQSRQWPHNF